LDPNIRACLEMIFRWIHVVAGIAWIGHLYFFNFVNSQVVKTYDADSKKKVVPELMPRALYWFRWGAAYTWVSGLLLAGMVYYDSENLLPPDSTLGRGAGVGLSLLLIVAVFFVLYFFNAMAPEMSPDGMAYHLWLPAEYALAHGFVRIPTSIFATV